MSLSQKHSGKVLVPWFNITEWKAIYNLIYIEEKQDWPKALQVLKIWKLRTPLLSAGVEGTLILLEGLLTIDSHNLSLYESTHILSTSLVRFLNLCAANSDKQGTFYKAAMQSGLPKWLVGLRHDIAHSHHVPSRSMLELSLRFCLDWLKTKYWDVQYECMSDLVVNKSDDTFLEDAVSIHIQLARSGILEDNRALMACINGLASSYDYNHFTSRQQLEHVNTILKNIIHNNTQGAAHKICELLIDSCIILQIDTETSSDGITKIPSNVLKKWNNFLDIIHETEVMPHFVNALFDFLCDEAQDSSHREVASLWIHEIFKAMLCQDKNDVNVLHFNSRNKFRNDRKFIGDVLNKPTPFTLRFLKEILEFNNAPSEFIEDCFNLMSALYTHKNHDSGIISTVKDLNVELPEHYLINELDKQPKCRWVLIEDCGPYRDLPLGILPQQFRHSNPLLDL